MEQRGRRTVKRPPMSPVDKKAQKKAAAVTDRKNKKVVDIRRYRKRKRRAGSTRWVRLLLFFIVCMLGGYFFSSSAFFNVENIIIQGNSVVSEDAVKRSSGINIGDNIFSISTEKAEQWTKINYMVASAEVHKKLPDTVIINIVERSPAALIPVTDGFLQVDDESVVVARYKSVDKPEFPIITGLQNVDAGSVLGTKIKVDNIDTALNVVKQMSDTAKKFITEINVSNAEKIVLYTKDNTEVRIGSYENFNEKFEVFYAIIEAQEKEGLLSSISYIDISLVSSPAIFYSK